MSAPVTFIGEYTPPEPVLRLLECIHTSSSRNSWISCKPVGCVGAISKTVYHLNFLDVLHMYEPTK